jgi:transposase
MEYTEADQKGKRIMAKEQKTYTKEFKREAVRLAETSGKPITELARELGVSDSTIHNWRRQFTEHGSDAFPGSGHQTPIEDENRRLKRELEIVKQERDILKKAIIVFSRHQP